MFTSVYPSVRRPSRRITGSNLRSDDTFRRSRAKKLYDPPVERLRRLATLWNYLPGFRAVAESQHLPTASHLLFVSPSALSRTIRLLEEDLGRSLFDRVGRNIELNAAGRRLLSGVRDAMRLVDEVLAAI